MNNFNNFDSNFNHLYSTCRAKFINFNEKSFYIRNLENPEFREALIEQYSTIIFRNAFSVNITKSIVCKEIFMTIPSVIYTPKNFFLIDAMNEKIENFKAAGLIKYWHFRVFDDKSMFKVIESKTPRVIQMHHLLGCFQLWFYGLLLSILIFIKEILSRNRFIKSLKFRFQT